MANTISKNLRSIRDVIVKIADAHASDDTGFSSSEREKIKKCVEQLREIAIQLDERGQNDKNWLPNQEKSPPLTGGSDDCRMGR